MFTSNKIVFSLVVAAFAITGCGGQPDGENVESSSEALAVPGNWSAVVDVTNIPSGYYYTDTPGHVICEVDRLESGGDNKSHPGKFFNSQCRYAYGGNIVYSSTFRVLMAAPPPSHPLAGITFSGLYSGGTWPDNVIVSSAGTLPVCEVDADPNHSHEHASGLVYNNQCQYEYGGSIHFANTFWFLVYTS